MNIQALLSLVVLIFSGCQVVAPQIEEEVVVGAETPFTEVDLNEPEETIEPEPEEIISEIRGENSPLSLKSFLDGEFIGKDFTIGRLFKEWGTHNSYYAEYMSNGLKISGTWHVPAGDGPFPVLILNHGYFPPETYKNGYGFGREQKYFARKGYAVLHIDYRGYAFSDKDPEALTGRRFASTGYSADAVNAILALKESGLPYLDMNRVGMFGHSMGGGVTLNAALARPDLMKAAVVWGPVSADFEDNYFKWTENRMTPESTEIFESTFGPLNDSDSFKALSALTYLDRLKTPLLIQHGTADESCDIEWSRTLDRALLEFGADYKYIEYEGAPHVFWYDDWDTAIKEAARFFEEHL